jgi:hypothetical protein
VSAAQGDPKLSARVTARRRPGAVNPTLGFSPTAVIPATALEDDRISRTCRRAPARRGGGVIERGND